MMRPFVYAINHSLSISPSHFLPQMRAVWNVEGHVYIPTSGGLYLTADGGATAAAVAGWGAGIAYR